MDSGTTLGNFLKVDSLESQIVLLLFLSCNDDTFGSINTLVNFEAQKVLDLESFASIKDIDDNREVRIGKHHFEFVADCDSSNHVSNDTSNSSQHCVSLLLLKPHPESKSLLVILFGVLFGDLKGNVTEAFCKFSKWAFNSDCSGFNFNSDSIWDF